MKLTLDAQAIICDRIDDGTIDSDARLDLVLHHAEYLAKKTCDPIVSAKCVATAIRECFSSGLLDHRE